MLKISQKMQSLAIIFFSKRREIHSEIELLWTGTMFAKLNDWKKWSRYSVSSESLMSSGRNFAQNLII